MAQESGGGLRPQSDARPLRERFLELLAQADGEADLLVEVTTDHLTAAGWMAIHPPEGLDKRLQYQVIVGAAPLPEDVVADRDGDGFLFGGPAGALKAARDTLGLSVEGLTGVDALMSVIRAGRLHVRVSDHSPLGPASVRVSAAGQQVGMLAGVGGVGELLARQACGGGVLSVDSSELQRHAEWFASVWQSARDFTNELRDLYREWRLLSPPEHVYLRILDAYLAGTDSATAAVAADVGGGDDRWLDDLTEFQKVGALRAQGILNQEGGVLIADEVGLGKTYLGGALVKRVFHRGGRVLVVAPRPIVDTAWTEYIHKYDLGARVTLRTYDGLKKGVDGRDIGFDPEGFDLVVVDEAHNVRNDNERRTALTNLLTLSPQAGKVFLTATPLVNQLKDIYQLLGMFLSDPAISDTFQKWNAMDVEALPWPDIWRLLDRVTVRRTREHVRDHYIETGDTWSFPRRHPPQRVDIDLPQQERDLVTEVISALDSVDSPGATLLLAAYQPQLFALEPAARTRGAGRGLYRSMLLRRLESSPEAFAETCDSVAEACRERWRAVHDALKAREQGEPVTYVSWGPLEKGAQVHCDDEQGEADSEDDDNPRGSRFLDAPESEQDLIVDDYDLEALQEALDADRELLRSWAARAREIASEPLTHPKVLALLKIMAETAVHVAALNVPEGHIPTAADRRKILVFTHATATAKWLAHAIHNALQGPLPAELEPARVYLPVNGADVPYVHGQLTKKARADKIHAFAPTTYSPDDPPPEQQFDILIATDFLSEGVNLQQACRVVNMDLPWTISRLIQRMGRVDRLMSPHATVYNHCVFPEQGILAQYLTVEAHLQRKKALTEGAFGAGSGSVLPTEDTATANMETMAGDYIGEFAGNQDLRAMWDLGRDGNDPTLTATREAPGPDALRRRLTEAKADHHLWEQVQSLPPAPGAMFHAEEPDRPGWIFCARIKGTGENTDTGQPIFLTLNEHPDGTTALTTQDPHSPWVALLKGDPTGEIDRSLTPGLTSAEGHISATEVLHAWPYASQIMAKHWNTAPPRTRDNADFVRANTGMTQTELKTLAADSLTPERLEHLIAVTRGPLSDLDRKVLKDHCKHKNFYAAWSYAVRRQLRTHHTHDARTITTDTLELLGWIRVLPPTPCPVPRAFAELPARYFATIRDTPLGVDKPDTLNRVREHLRQETGHDLSLDDLRAHYAKACPCTPTPLTLINQPPHTPDEPDTTPTGPFTQSTLFTTPELDAPASSLEERVANADREGWSPREIARTNNISVRHARRLIRATRRTEKKSASRAHPQPTRSTPDRGPKTTPAVKVLLECEAIESGTRLTLNLDCNERGTPKAHNLTRAHRDAIQAWVDENPLRGLAHWTPQAQCLTWAVDGKTYTPTGLAETILKEVSGQERSIRGTTWWVTPDGHTLVELADAFRPTL